MDILSFSDKMPIRYTLYFYKYRFGEAACFIFWLECIYSTRKPENTRCYMPGNGLNPLISTEIIRFRDHINKKTDISIDWAEPRYQISSANLPYCLNSIEEYIDRTYNFERLVAKTSLARYRDLILPYYPGPDEYIQR